MQILKTDDSMNCLIFFVEAPISTHVTDMIKKFGSFVSSLYFTNYPDFDKSVAKRIYNRLIRFQEIFVGDDTEMIFGTKGDRGPVPKKKIMEHFTRRRNVEIPIVRTEGPLQEWKDDFEKQIEVEVETYRRKHGLGGVVLDSFESDDDSDDDIANKSKRRIL